MNQLSNYIDVLDIDPIQVSNKNLKPVCESAMWRSMRILREILGPNLPYKKKGVSESIIQKDGIHFKKESEPVLLSVYSNREIEIQEQFLSDDYLFWGYWFKEWVSVAHIKANDYQAIIAQEKKKNQYFKEDPENKKTYKEKDYWEFEAGTWAYSEYATRINKAGEKIPGRGMSDGTINLLEEIVSDEIEKLYDNFSHKSLLKEDTNLIFDCIRDFSWILRIKNLKTISNSHKKAIKRSISDLKKIERKYILGTISYFDKIIQKISDELINNELPGGGWRRDYYKGQESALNTGEVGSALTTVLSKTQRKKLAKSLSKLTDLIRGDGYWETSHSQRESMFANAFATNYLLKCFGWADYNTVLVATRLENKIYEIGPLSHIHKFCCFCHSVRALSRAYGYGMGCGLTDTLLKCKALILKYQTDYWKNKDNTVQDHRIATLATSIALLAITKIAEALEESFIEERVQLSNMLMAHPEKPEVNTVRVKIESRGRNPFDHWVKPWKVSALALQPHVDRLYLIDITRNLLEHYDEEYRVVSHKINHPSVWATSHFLYALGIVTENLKNHYLQQGE